MHIGYHCSSWRLELACHRVTADIAKHHSEMRRRDTLKNFTNYVKKSCSSPLKKWTAKEEVISGFVLNSTTASWVKAVELLGKTMGPKITVVDSQTC